ncbi:hypothetical protein AB0N99_30775 [Streptomyces sp. NPDC093272]|uniref:hypothetical protein n=1 Tax=Streptomyces sp. NPDC093272 TaxID=3154981 RepID=UPI00341D6563
MALRFTVQGDDQAETTAGLRLLLAAGLRVSLPPVEVTRARWMARAVPGDDEAPDGEGRGFEGAG